MITSCEEIRKSAGQSFDGVIQWFESNEAQFDYTPYGKWSAGAHLDHLIKSIKPLNKAMTLSKTALGIMFGKSKGTENTYNELVERYTAILAVGGKASGQYVPSAIIVADREDLLKSYQKQKEYLSKTLGSWSEEQLSKYQLSHPLLGKLTVREMLFFTINHTNHHLKILERDYS